MSNKNTFKSTLEIAQALDRLHRERGFGERGSVYRDMLRGIDVMNNGTFVMNNRDNKGYTFFTRPCLNLTYSNLSQVRRLLPYRDAGEYSILNYCRTVLDPWSQRSLSTVNQERHVDGSERDVYAAPEADKHTIAGNQLCDPKSPFISSIGNNLLSLTGWPDPVVDYYTSSKGLMGEEHIMADGVYDRYGSFSLEATLRNPEGNPHTLLFDLWETYMSAVKLNDMQPYPEMIMCQEIDYMTRIYRFVMDPNKQYITMWSACGAGFPVNNAMGTIYNFDSEKELTDGTQTLNFSFQCVGAMYNDPILLDEFNRLMAIYNPALRIRGVTNNGRDNLIVGRDDYVKLKLNEKKLFNYQAYPLVNEQTYELEWWVPKTVYNKIKGKRNGE